jgi:N-acetylmuramoyl-L-alanine amidase
MRLLTEEAIILMTLWAEARGEPLEGMLAVAEVIRRRTKLHYNSDGSLTDTCTRNAQFSCWNNDDEQRPMMFRLTDQEPLVMRLGEVWENSEFTDYSNGAVLYYSPAAMKPTGSVPWWAPKCRKVAEVGPHVFYVELR